MYRKLIFVLPVVFFCSCAELGQIGGAVLTGLSEGELSTEQIGMGLKEALVKGVTNGTGLISQKDGYFKNAAIKILFPPEAQKIKTKLDGLGMSNLTNNLVEKLNRAAEDAATGAKPIFVNAIKQLTITDAMDILMGEKNAATSFLKRTTSNALYGKFNPVINKSLGKVKALDYWGDIINTYNKIPFVQKMNPDLDDYVTNKAMDGVFHMVEKEEAKIRVDPMSRTTDLLKKVFAKQDS